MSCQGACALPGLPSGSAAAGRGRKPLCRFLMVWIVGLALPSRAASGAAVRLHVMVRVAGHPWSWMASCCPGEPARDTRLGETALRGAQVCHCPGGPGGRGAASDRFLLSWCSFLTHSRQRGQETQAGAGTARGQAYPRTVTLERQPAWGPWWAYLHARATRSHPGSWATFQELPVTPGD